MPSDKCNSIMVKALGLVTVLLNVVSTRDMMVCCSFTLCHVPLYSHACIGDKHAAGVLWLRRWSQYKALA